MPNGVALPSIQAAGLSLKHGADGAALGQAPTPHQDDQVEMPGGERLEVLLQPGVGGHVADLVRAVAAVR